MPNEPQEPRRTPNPDAAVPQRRRSVDAPSGQSRPSGEMQRRRRPAEGQSAPVRRTADGTPRPEGTRRRSADTPPRRPAEGPSAQPRRRADGSQPAARSANPGQYRNPRRRRRRRNNTPKYLAIGLMVILVIAGIFLLRGGRKPEEKAEETTPATTEPEIVHQTSTATITATGDVLMHLPVINTGLQSDGSYNFDGIFRYVNQYAAKADYAAANLETTLCGADNGYKYSGFPCFNCPDAIVDSLKKSGFDMLLTANNHCYDTLGVGFKRTIEVIRRNGLDNLGTMATPQDPKFAVKDLNGIKVGMLCYTYEQPIDDPAPGIVYLNYIPMDAGGNELINSFLPADPAPFYTEVEGYIRQMKQAGAEAIVMFIHWGIEYNTMQSDEQQVIAQKLCDLGVDVIIGGHPHVVQPVQLLTSNTEPGHTTLCLYSMGNAVSNQRQGNLTSITTPHTEDGVLFSVTFSKYSDGTVYLDSADLIPTWVRMDGDTDSPTAYTILPLDPAVRSQWQTKYDLSDGLLTAANNSYARTMAIVEKGLTAAQDYLTHNRTDRDNAYAGIIEETAETEAPETEAEAA